MTQKLCHLKEKNVINKIIPVWSHFCFFKNISQLICTPKAMSGSPKDFIFFCFLYYLNILVIPLQFFFLTSLLEYSCFTMVCWFLLYNKVNQLYTYIHPHIPSLLPLPPPSLLHPSRWSQSTKLISLCYAAASH